MKKVFHFLLRALRDMIFRDKPALSNDPLGNFNPEMTYELNHEATVRLAELAKKAGIQRYVFSSSCSVYGASGADLVTEESRLNPVTPYGISKNARAERRSRILFFRGYWEHKTVICYY